MTTSETVVRVRPVRRATSARLIGPRSYSVRTTSRSLWTRVCWWVALVGSAIGRVVPPHRPSPRSSAPTSSSRWTKCAIPAVFVKSLDKDPVVARRADGSGWPSTCTGRRRRPRILGVADAHAAASARERGPSDRTGGARPTPGPLAPSRRVAEPPAGRAAVGPERQELGERRRRGRGRRAAPRRRRGGRCRRRPAERAPAPRRGSPCTARRSRTGRPRAARPPTRHCQSWERRDLGGRRVLHQVVDRRRAVAAEPGVEVLERDRHVQPDAGLGHPAARHARSRAARRR